MFQLFGQFGIVGEHGKLKPVAVESSNVFQVVPLARGAVFLSRAGPEFLASNFDALCPFTLWRSRRLAKFIRREVGRRKCGDGEDGEAGILRLRAVKEGSTELRGHGEIVKGRTMREWKRKSEECAGVLVWADES